MLNLKSQSLLRSKYKLNSLSRLIASVVVLFVVVSGPNSSADFTFPNVAPGTQYRLAFVTSGQGITALSSNISTYDSFVSNQANSNPVLAALGTTWKTIGSTPSVNARDHTGTNPITVGLPIYNLNGDLVASSNSDLWDGSLLAPIQFDAFGNLNFTGVWTGTSLNGTGTLLHQLGTFDPTQSRSYLVDGGWVDLFLGDAVGSQHYYGMSGVLTSVPEPSSMLLVVFGSIALWTRSRHRKSNF